MFVSLVVSARPRCKLYPLPLPAHSSCSALDHFSRSSVSARLHWRKSSGQRCSGANHSRPRFDYSKDMRLGTSPHPVHLLRYTLYSYLFFGCLATYSRSRRLALVGLCSFFTLVVHRHGIKEEAVRLLELRTTVARPSLYDRALGEECGEHVRFIVSRSTVVLYIITCMFHRNRGLTCQWKAATVLKTATVS